MADKKIIKEKDNESSTAKGAMMVILFICALLVVGFAAYENDVFSADVTKVHIQVPGTSGGNGG